MYKKIKNHPTTLNIYEKQLLEEKILSQLEADNIKIDFKKFLDEEFELV